jgi:P-type Cu2+ transporter
MATPLAVTVALGRAARRQILIKGGEVLELLARPGTVFLDKTGTLTAGRTSVLSWRGDESALPLVAALEQHSAHPIAVALVRDSARTNRAGRDRRAAVDNVRQTTGGGLAGTVDGREVVVGSARFVREQGFGRPMRRSIGPNKPRWPKQRHPVLVAVDGRIVAVAALGDPLREDAATRWPN